MKVADYFNKELLSKLTVGEALIYNEMKKELEEFDRRWSGKFLETCKVQNDLAEMKDDIKNRGFLIAEIYKKLRESREDWEMVQKQVFCVEMEEEDLDLAGGSEKVETYEIARRNIELPQDGEEYWYVEADGDVESDIYKVHGICEMLHFERWKFGNYFRSEKEAEAAKERIRKALIGGKEE